MEKKNALIFIDYDNVFISFKEQYEMDIIDLEFPEKIIKFLEDRYFISEIIAYGNFDNGLLSKDKHQTLLQQKGIQTRHVMNGKDSADIAIVCDALEKLYVNSSHVELFVIISSDRDMTQLINKIKSKGKLVHLIPLAINIDWDVMINYGDIHDWLEEILKIDFSEPKLSEKVTDEIFLENLAAQITERKTDINYSLFSSSLNKKYKTQRSKIDLVKDSLLDKKKIEFYEYDFRGKTYYDGIRIIETD